MEREDVPTSGVGDETRTEKTDISSPSLTGRGKGRSTDTSVSSTLLGDPEVKSVVTTTPTPDTRRVRPCESWVDSRDVGHASLSDSHQGSLRPPDHPEPIPTPVNLDPGVK